MEQSLLARDDYDEQQQQKQQQKQQQQQQDDDYDDYHQADVEYQDEDRPEDDDEYDDDYYDDYDDDYNDYDHDDHDHDNDDEQGEADEERDDEVPSHTARSSLSQQFALRQQERHLRDELEEEPVEVRRAAEIERMLALEREMLSRTIFVTDVVDLTKKQNLNSLRAFFKKKTLDGIERIWVTNYHGEEVINPIWDANPPARIRFKSERDAKYMLGDRQPLVGSIMDYTWACAHLGTRTSTRKDGDKRKFVTVRPSHWYPGMLQDSKQRHILEFKTKGLSLGSWCPVEKDALQLALLDKDNPSDLSEIMSDEWLQEESTDLTPLLRINFKKQQIELQVDRIEDDDGKFSFDSMRDYAIFPFKSLLSKLELCRDESLEENQYTLIFAVKHPPRLETEEPKYGAGHAIRQFDRRRRMKFDRIPACRFGECYGYRLELTQDVVQGIMGDQYILDTLTSFGLLLPTLCSTDQARSVQLRYVGEAYRQQIHAYLKQIHALCPAVGFQLRAMYDNGLVTPCHAMTEHTCYKRVANHVFEFVLGTFRATTDDNSDHAQLQAALHAMRKSRTRFPCELLQHLLEVEEVGVSQGEAKHTPSSKQQHRSKYLSIPRLQLSPCRQSVQPFEVEIGNSFVRRFVQEEQYFTPDCFLRLSVCDENGDKLFFRDLVDELVVDMKRRLVEPMDINGRKYQFFVYSASQLKESGAWMVYIPPGSDWSIQRMRFTLGDFSKCQTVPLFAARIGQFLSTSFQGLEGADAVVRCHRRDGIGPTQRVKLRHKVIPDIVAGGGKAKHKLYHSDGNGMISRSVANELLKGLPDAPRDPNNVSIVQVRYGGCKGTLGIWDDIHLGQWPKTDVLIRKETMVKFAAPYRYLEICSIGKHAPYYLNRNVILLLCIHRIQNKVFIDMQKNMLRDLDRMLVDGDKALQMTKSIGMVDDEMRNTICDMLESGFRPSEEPFLLSCLMAIRTHNLYGLFKKARIFVQNGAVLMGGLDILGVLPAGTVFVQIRRDKGNEKEPFFPIVGPVMVTKHPVMHPGDVRMLLAVDIPELRHHRNVILFSQKGPRPEADKMAGSDLDGDEFAVTWDSRLFMNQWNKCRQNKDGSFVATVGKKKPLLTMKREEMEQDAAILQKANEKPFHYQPPGKHEGPGVPDESEPLTEALANHVFEFAKNDSLGRIGMLWQDFAARYTAKCWQCLELSELHAVAVDYPKRGIPAVVRKEVSLSGNQPRAHWREKWDVPSFHCESIIGQLYDQVKDVTRTTVVEKTRKWTADGVDVGMAGRDLDRFGQVTSLVSSENLTDCLEQCFDDRIEDDLAPVTPPPNMLLFARQLRLQYELDMIALMNHHGLKSEGEVATGCIRKFHKTQQRRQHDVSQEICRKRQAIRKKYRSLFFEEVLRLVRRDPKPVQVNHGGSRNGRLELRGSTVMDWVEEVASGNLSEDSGIYSADWARICARQLAAACYLVTYSPEGRSDHPSEHRQVLFSFPWLFSDVIAHGLRDDI